MALTMLFTGFAKLSYSQYSQPEAPAEPDVPGPIPESVLREQAAARAVKSPVSGLGLSVEEWAPDAIGLKVLFVVKGSPAEKAGLIAGDLLEHFDDQILIAPKQLEVLVKRSPVGTKALLTLRREEVSLKLPVTLEAASPPVPPSPELVSRDFEITKRTVRLTVGRGDDQRIVTLTTKEGRAHLVVTQDSTVEAEGPVSAESEIPPHLRASVQRVASLEDGKWKFLLPVLPPVEQTDSH